MQTMCRKKETFEITIFSTKHIHKRKLYLHLKIYQIRLKENNNYQLFENINTEKNNLVFLKQSHLNKSISSCYGYDQYLDNINYLYYTSNYNETKI